MTKKHDLRQQTIKRAQSFDQPKQVALSPEQPVPASQPQTAAFQTTAQQEPPSSSGPALDSMAQQKEVEFYAALANGWVATRMEYDKNLVTLSAGGIGLFITLLTTIGVHSWWEAGFYVFGAMGFIGAIAIGLKIFLRNADFFQELVKGGGLDGDPVLKRLDRWLVRLFLVGATGALLAGASAAISKYHNKETPMSTEGKQEGSHGQSNKPAAVPESKASPIRLGGDSLTESVNGVQSLRPDLGNVAIHSIDGMQRLRPTASTSAPVQPTPPSPNDQSATTKKP